MNQDNSLQTFEERDNNWYIINSTIYRNIGGIHMLIPIKRNDKVKNFIIINETGSLIWKKLCEQTNKKNIISDITIEYNVPEKTIQNDVDNFISQLTYLDII